MEENELMIEMEHTHLYHGVGESSRLEHMGDLSHTSIVQEGD